MNQLINIMISFLVNQSKRNTSIDLNTQQLSLGFSGSLWPIPSRDTLRVGGMGPEKLTMVFKASAG